MEKDEVYIIGHKNPDTDSICSAIAYAELKNKIHGSEKYSAKRAGHINGETKFVLEKFGVKAPEYITDVGTQVKDIEINTNKGVNKHISLKSAYELMKKLKVVSLAVVDDNNYLEGIITIGDIANSDMDVYDNRIISKAKTSYRNIVETLDGKMLVGDINGCLEKGKVLIGAASPELLESYLEENDMIILGNRTEVQLQALEMKAGCLIVCMGAAVKETILRLAEEKGCAVISAPYDTYTVARLVNQSMPIGYFMTNKNLSMFSMEDFTEEIRPIMANKRHRHYPITDVFGKYYGTISRRSLLDTGKKKVILVDHNEKAQAVDNVDDCEILEIIDHHRLGNLETLNPVFFRNQPVGATATIILQMYLENGIELSRDIAGILCAAIISDTLMFRSPTCTYEDKSAVHRLAEIAQIDIKSFADDIFKAGSNLKEKTVEEIFYQDFKKFDTNGVKFGVGQISALNSEEFKNIKNEILSYMDKIEKELDFDMIMFMMTNIIDESTEVLVKGYKSREIIYKAFGEEVLNDSITLEHMVSRKKQFIPKIISAIQN